MNKKVLVIMITGILTIGAMTVVYAKGNDNTTKYGTRGSMMYQNTTNRNETYNKMIDVMKNNGFEDAAKAMESKDYNAMSTFMNKLTDEEYNKMTDLMEQNGFKNMGQMMRSVDKNNMVNMHNFMMRNNR
ncbi:hypothetical protein [Clostridium folliculivorans]|uniref:Uncharacterized protein n=1 Tax=Clostridium folliculivorans TaxID=2886038 RepID=A0A9W5Y005_9CLOT|nr:hypothetical protein [Clostridium folliculivorans]GKU24097.1 hypothetical protein CFOLD11_09230 [Clostridium folliculivorans]GKU30203.1 hypothetical protein CFB3_23100 [Clostridium folliculivorans]